MFRPYHLQQLNMWKGQSGGLSCSSTSFNHFSSIAPEVLVANWVIFFFRFIFSDVDLNPIMHSSVWCVVLTVLLLLLITQDGDGKLSIFCCQNLNSFSRLASSYKFSGRTCSFSNLYPTIIRDVTWARFAWNAVLVPWVFSPRLRAQTWPERTPGSHARSLSYLNCSY